eukprot:Platyproteum_vivax@DN10387_c0_g1_i1.p1
MGNLGRSSRVLNDSFTPVTHSLIPVSAAPGQLSAVDVIATRNLLGLPYHNYLVFGKPIGKSASPAFHNAVFSERNPACIYSKCETDNPLVFKTHLSSPRFWGGSVTIPLKEKVMAFLDEVSPEAQEIGAVNTVYRRDKDSSKAWFIGTNTDWLAIQRGIFLVPNQKGKCALVIGAGGAARAACFAVRKCGMHLYIWNRTVSKAEQLAKEFGGKEFSPDVTTVCSVLISTVPGTSEIPLDPTRLFKSQPLAIDMAYLPKVTPFLIQAEKFNCQTVLGIDILIWQGLEQQKCYLNTNNFTSEEEKRFEVATKKFYDPIANSAYKPT